jgi:signal transduction histidine kinase
MTDGTAHHAGVGRWQRLLLPADFLDAPAGSRSARDWFVDVNLLAFAVAAGAVALATTWDEHSRFAKVLDIALGVIACIALWRRRTQPVPVAVLAIGVSLISSSAGGPALVALFNAALRAPRRPLPGIVALALVAMSITPLLYPGDDGYGVDILVGLLCTAIAVGWGQFVRVRRDLVVSLRERATRLEAAQRLHVEQARDAERRRIAREMHDVLAHRVSLLSLHAGALEFRPDAPPEEIAEAAGVIRATAHSALEELRDIIGVLREGSEREAPEPPQPTLAQVPALIEESEAAGMRVRFDIDVPGADAMPATLARTAYRVVQEGLTNARKHAPGAAVNVAITTEGEPPGRRVVVAVVSRRPVAVVAVRAERLPGAGTGLIGLAERVALSGGELRHGPDEHGDFVLRATLPWPA